MPLFWPKSRKQWILSVVAVLGGCALLLGMVMGKVEHDAEFVARVDVCEEDRKGCEDAKRQYEEMAARQKKRCDERMEQWDKERETLTEAVKRCPCCEGGCTKELLHKEYLLQSQATYYKKHLKKVCGVRRPPDPDEKELVNFMKEIEEEEEEVF